MKKDISEEPELNAPAFNPESGEPTQRPSTGRNQREEEEEEQDEEEYVDAEEVEEEDEEEEFDEEFESEEEEEEEPLARTPRKKQAPSASNGKAPAPKKTAKRK